MKTKPTKTTIKPNKTTTRQIKKPDIKDLWTNSNQGIILIDQPSIQDIYTKSGKLAKDNEFQVHYWSLIFRFRAADQSILDICIPTVYFNYKQEVSGAAIDFSLKDVKEMSAKVEPIHNMKVNELLATPIKSELESLFNVQFESTHADFGSIHRHPGSSASQSFSGTDLDTDSDDFGVVFPFERASNDAPNFAGIMAIDDDTCNIAHFEYRTANGTLGTDLEYVEGRCKAIIVKAPTHLSAVESIIGASAPSPILTKSVRTPDTPVLRSVESIAVDLFHTHNFQPSTHAISDTHLTRKTYVSHYAYSYFDSLDSFSLDFGTNFKPESIGKLQQYSLYQLDEYYERLHYKVHNTKVISCFKSKPEALSCIKELHDKLDDKSTNGKQSNNQTYTEAYFKSATIPQLKAEYRLLYKEILDEFPVNVPNTKNKLQTAILDLVNNPTNNMEDEDAFMQSDETLSTLTKDELVAYANQLTEEVYGIEFTCMGSSSMEYETYSVDDLIEEIKELQDIYSYSGDWG